MSQADRFQNQAVIVSGGADGMGAACVRQLSREGAKVFVLDVKIRDAEALAVALRGDGGDVTAIAADVMDEAQLETAFDQAIGLADGKIGALINIAGGSASGLISEIDLATWDRLYRLNVRSTLVACRKVIPSMRAGRSGAIVNMASISGLRGDPEWAPYNAAKAAVISLTQSLAWEEGRYGIRVNAICPGPIASERMLATISADELTEYNNATALGRIGRADELAEAILFLASYQSSFITGTTLVADGGLTATTAQPTAFGHKLKAGLIPEI